jgi:hypothetical protein
MNYPGNTGLAAIFNRRRTGNSPRVNEINFAGFGKFERMAAGGHGRIASAIALAKMR